MNCGFTKENKWFRYRAAAIIVERETVDELMQIKTETKENMSENKVDEIIDTVLKGIGIAMGIAVVVLSVLGELETNTAFIMLGIGLACISISLLKDKKVN